MGDGRDRGVTISDVAAVAGVSRQTVSNVLNAPWRVAAETAQRVRHTIDELGYRPNRTAQNLRVRTSRLIGFRISAYSGLTSFLDRFLHALTEAARDGGYHVLLFTPATMAEELATYEDLIRTRTVDGFVLADVRFADQRLPWFTQREIPFVCFGRPWGQEHGRFAWVDVDGGHGVEQAVDHLVARGHRRIAYLGYRKGTGFGDERKNGWLHALRRHGLPTDGLSGTSDEDVSGAAAAARRLLARRDPPTAFVCGSDAHAIGVRLAAGAPAGSPAGSPAGAPGSRAGAAGSRARAAGVAVIGFDDSPAATLISPPMSSVRQPLEEVAHCVIDLLVKRLQGPPEPAGGVLLRPALVVRDDPAPGDGLRPAIT